MSGPGRVGGGRYGAPQSAHSEYVKLQRSAADGKVFDRIDAVYDRYVAGGMERNSIEVWKFNRQVPNVPPGTLLRIQADKPFLLHWTSDGWQSSTDTRSTATTLNIDFVDVLAPDRDGPIRFTFFWTEENRWDGKDYTVEIVVDA